MQLGHEPIPERETTTLTGAPATIRPNVFQYIGHIIEKDGFFGCFRGLPANLVGLIAALQLAPILIKFGITSSRKSVSEIMAVPNIVTDDEPVPEDYYKVSRRDIIVHVANLIISYPFLVVAMRMMAAFADRDQAYETTIDAVISIYKESTFLGFYAGFIPRILADIYAMIVTSVLVFYVNKHIFKTKDLRQFTSPLVTVLSTPVSYLYPLYLTSIYSAVSGSSLQMGNPPNMPVYWSWLTCLWDIITNSIHKKRPGSLFFRYVNPNLK